MCACERAQWRAIPGREGVAEQDDVEGGRAVERERGAAVEYILGIRRQGDRLTVNPVIPGSWPGFSATLNIGGTTCRISVERRKGIKTRKLLLGGKDAGSVIPLGKGGNIEVTVQIPA